MAMTALPAAADTVPVDPTDPKTPPTVSADALPTVQINGVVWQQLVVGSTVYVAGSFTSARPAGSAPGVNETPRANLLAYDLASGNLITSFNATLNQQAKALATSPDGSRLYVAGDFTTVNGTAQGGVAALNPVTGALLTDFAPTINTGVKALAVTSDKVFVGGSFSTVNGSARPRLGALTPTGALVAGFAPTVADGGVNALVLSPDSNKLVFGGSFGSVNGSSNPGYGLAAVSPSTGASLALGANQVVRNAGASSAITSLSSDGTNLYGSGYVYGAGGNLEGAFSSSWSDPNLGLRWLEDCHGDTYGVYAAGGAVYTAGHMHFCGNVGGFPETSTRSFHRAMAWSVATSGTVAPNTTGSYFNFAGQPAPALQNWFPDINSGTYTGQAQGPWTVTGTADYVTYGGEFTEVNGVPQQGLVRFAVKNLAPNASGPMATAASFQPSAVAVSPGVVKISWPANWDRDNTNLTYTVYCDDVPVPGGTVTAPSTFWNRPALSYTASGLTTGSHTWKVVVSDPTGNTVTSPTAVTDVSVPSVTSRTPGAGVTGVAPSDTTGPTATKVTFSEDVVGVSPTTFTLKLGTTKIAAGVAYDSVSRTATLTPAAALATDSKYTVLLTAGIQSRSGGSLVPLSWNYTTGPAPTVKTVSPAAASTGVATTTSAGPTPVTATFSEPVTGLPTTSASTANFTLKQGSTLVPTHVVYDPSTLVATLVPDVALTADKTYVAYLSASVKDVGGNPIAAKSWTFITGPRPTVTTRSPAAGATKVARTSTVSATFSEAVTGLPTTAASTTAFTLKNNTTGATTSSSVLYSSSTGTATLTPGGSLAASTTYTVTVTGAVKDVAGNPLTATSWTFTTGL